ncbi:hypothetical protein IEO21_00186 [Rhodonia placenta]|uniref:Uncharacterized protein n=1 Tax=Rhodonia placenta TaxID=104341 RepID=A0A8H7PCH8_9APHY|nr:hypothetical protein IEO21_00186 [Postia placenta]
MARFAALFLIAAALPFAFATSSTQQCSDMEFFYPDKACCLPYGGQQNPPTPPQGNQQCPSSGWEWHDGKQCCVPQQPPEQNPPPQCGGGWEWNHDASTCCEPTKSSSAPKSTPSANRRSNAPTGNHKRNLKSRAHAL